MFTVSFRDTGLLLSLLQIKTHDELARSVMLGTLFENVVISRLVTLAQLYGLGECNFIRHKHGLDVDLAIVGADQVLLIECKYA